MDNDDDNRFSNELDSTITFRVNSELKKEFEKLCNSEISSMSRELNLFMRKAVTKGTLNIERAFF